MRTPTSLTSASLVALLVACGTSPKSPFNEGPPEQPAPSAPDSNGESGAVAASAALPPDSILIGAAETVAIPGALVAVEGRDLALAIVDFAEAEGAWLRTVSPDGNLGAFHALPGAHIVRASGFEGAPKETFELLTSESASLCTRTFDVKSDRLGPAKCLTAEADAVVATASGWAFIDARPDPLQAPAVTEPVRRPPPKKKRAPKSGKKKRDEDARKAAEVTKAAVARLMDSGEKRLLFAAPWGEPFEPTDFEFREAMAGLSVVGASHRNGKTTVLVTERASEAEKNQKKNDKERLGRLTTLRLDDELRLIEGSEKHFAESPLDPGYLRDHASMGLTEIPGGAFALGRRGFRGKCDITLIDPYLMQLIADPEDCAIDLRRFLVTARARHDGNAPELGPDPDVDFASVKARWTDGGSTYQRAVFGTTHAFSFSEKELFVWKVGEPVARFPSPFLAARSRLLWGAHANDGSSLAQVGHELIRVDGTEVQRSPSPWPLESRSDLLRSLPTQAVKLGDTWWAARGTIAPIFPPSPKVAVRGGHDDAILIEGAPDRPGSVVVSRVHGRLTVTPLSGEGMLGRPLSLARTVHGGLDAVRTAKGTILVSSQRADHQVELTAISASLDRATEQPPIGARELRLVARPSGGAWAFDEGRGQVLWLDDQGAVLAERAITPRGASRGTLCRDGRPAPANLPKDAPGEMLDLPADVTCWVGLPAAASEGRYRVFSSLNSGAQATLRTFADPGTGGSSGDVKTASAPSSAARVTPLTEPSHPARCPSDMVLVMDRLCVDRFEGSLLGPGGLHLSPDYPATPGLLATVLLDFGRGYSLYGPLTSRAIPLPEIPPDELAPLLRGETLPLSVESRQHLLPSAFVTGHVAKEVCAARGKRLCKLEEWRTACRGEKNRKFPYGDVFDPGACNVAKDIHPGVVLHDNASVGHLDPRLNRVGAPSGGLLRETGTTPRCKSEWGSDAIFDMVGNVDEWVDERAGAFAGGFYARPTRSGCESLVSAHPFGYLDYSTGVRCCADATPTE